MAVPAETPVTTLEEFTVAMALLLLLHVPLVVPSPRVVVDPAHTVVVPVMANGIGFTVIVNVLLQPVGNK